MSVMSEFSIGDSREQLTEQFVELVEQINHSMHCTPSEGWVELDLTISQIRVLALLYQGQERMGNIASYLGCIMSSATSIIDRLVDKQLVARLPGSADRRVVVCELTPLGRETMEQFWSIGRPTGRVRIEGSGSCRRANQPCRPNALPQSMIIACCRWFNRHSISALPAGNPPCAGFSFRLFPFHYARQILQIRARHYAPGPAAPAGHLSRRYISFLNLSEANP